MATKKIVFPKAVITRAENYDFSDDGTRFRGYLYKGVIPITYTRYKDEVFCDIRLDYLMRWEDYRNFSYSSGITDEFNGIKDHRFNMDKFVENCEKCFNFYKDFNSDEAKLKRCWAKVEEINKQIERLTAQRNELNSQIATLMVGV